MTTSNLDATRGAMRAEAEGLLDDTLHTYKAHFNADESWQRWHVGLGAPAAALAVFAGTAVAMEFPRWAAIILAFASAALAGTLTVLKPSERARKSRVAGDAIKELHGRLRRWLQIDFAVSAEAQARVALEAFASEKEKLDSSAPEVRRRDFDRARSGIAAGEASHDTGPYAVVRREG